MISPIGLLATVKAIALTRQPNAAIQLIQWSLIERNLISSNRLTTGRGSSLAACGGIVHFGAAFILVRVNLCRKPAPFSGAATKLHIRAGCARDQPLLIVEDVAFDECPRSKLGPLIFCPSPRDLGVRRTSHLHWD